MAPAAVGGSGADVGGGRRSANAGGSQPEPAPTVFLVVDRSQFQFECSTPEQFQFERSSSEQLQFRASVIEFVQLHSSSFLKFEYSTVEQFVQFHSPSFLQFKWPAIQQFFQQPPPVDQFQQLQQ